MYVKKIKELIFDFIKSTLNHKPLNIRACDEDIRNKFKNLHVVNDDQLFWSHHLYLAVSKCKQKLVTLKSFNVSFYASLIESDDDDDD